MENIATTILKFMTLFQLYKMHLQNLPAQHTVLPSLL